MLDQFAFCRATHALCSSVFAADLSPTHLCSTAVDKEAFSTPVLNHCAFGITQLNSRYYNQDLHQRLLGPASRHGLHSETLAPLYMPLSGGSKPHTAVQYR